MEVNYPKKGTKQSMVERNQELNIHKQVSILEWLQ